MAIETISMPHLGESVTEASIAVWLVKEGDYVNKYDPIAEAVSDKVTTEIPSNFSGTVKDILIDVDTDVDIGTPMMTIETDGTEEATVGNQEVTEEASNQVNTNEGERTEEFMQHINEEIDKEAEKGTVELDTSPGNTPTTERSLSDDSQKARYSPAVVRIAQERGIDLNQVKGTGKHGRITRKDVQNVDISAQKAEATPSAVQTEPTPEPISKDASKPSPASTMGETEVVAADGIRRAIAKKMIQSTTEIPHAWLTVEADVSTIVKLRNELKDGFKAKEGVSLSYFPFFVKAVVQAIKKHPIMNTSWDNGNIVYHKDINVSIAVATDDHLFVPVIHGADNYSISGLSKEINHLAQLARSGKLESKHIKGGTITVNNTGSFGSIQSMGIINHPQAAILQVESINKRFVPTEDGGFKVADMVNLCLSIDHRIIDGLQAGRFLKEVKENLARFVDESALY